ncbi:hypothetical protein BDAP_001622 [Binucleata daphniae]
MLFYFTIIFAHKYNIKLYNQEKFLRSRSANYELPNFGPYGERQSFTIKITPKLTTKKIISVEEKGNNVFDIASSIDTLIYYPVHYGPNQQFEIVPYNQKGVYYMMCFNKCVTWLENDLVLKIKDCVKDKEDQLFEFVCADCEEAAVEEKPAEPETTISVENFLTSETTVMISNIEKLVAQLSECFTVNGTCSALDDSTKNLFCYSPYDKIPQIYELWPDYKSNDIMDTTIASINK